LAYKQKRNNKLQNNENAMESGKQNNSEHREEKCTRVREKESDFDGSSGECHGIVKSTVSNAEDRMDSFSSGHEGVSYSFVSQSSPVPLVQLLAQCFSCLFGFYFVCIS
jgi:hypothetical protein